MTFTHLKTCEQITEDDFRLAVSSREATIDFLNQIIAIAKPNTSAGKVLYFFARLAQSEQLDIVKSDEFVELSIQVTPNRNQDRYFDIRLVATVGLEGRSLFKVTINCDFADLLSAVKDEENLKPFTCIVERDDFLRLEASQADCACSIPPTAYLEADARYQELAQAGMIPSLKPNQMVPTIPPPEEDDPAADIAYAVVTPDNPAPTREEQPSWADQAMELSTQAPSIPTGPISPEDSVRTNLAATIGRLSLVKQPVKGNRVFKNKADSKLEQGGDRSETETSVPPLPLVTPDKK